METEIYPTAHTDDGDPAYRTQDLDQMVAEKEQNSGDETDVSESEADKVVRLREKLRALDSDLEDVSRDLTRAIGTSVSVSDRKKECEVLTLVREGRAAVALAKEVEQLRAQEAEALAQQDELRGRKDALSRATDMLREEIKLIVTHRQREVRRRRQEVARTELPAAVAAMGTAIARYQILKSWQTTVAPAHIEPLLELRGALGGLREEQALALIEHFKLEEIPHA